MEAKIDNNKIPKVCLCGRPNVGKSSLYNRLSGKKRAIVLDEPGVTRDVNSIKVNWDGATLELADLAGLEFLGKNTSESEVRNRELHKLAMESAIAYLKQSDLVLFIVDARVGLTAFDEEIARFVRKQNKKVLMVLSKAENKSLEQDLQLQCSKMSWGEALATSAEHNLGIPTLKEKICEILGLEFSFEADTETDSVRPIQIGVYGRPNVGKSTFVNWIIGENRMITSPIAGTTIDTIDTAIERNNKRYIVLDTPGIRKKSKTDQGVEVLSVVKALSHLNKVDVALLIIDGYEGITDQDEKIAGELVEAGRSVVILVNKWDLCRTKKEEYANRIRETIGFLDFAPVLFISAKQKLGIDNLWDLINEIREQRLKLVSTGELNRFIELVEGHNNPTNVKIYYASQTSKNPPTITMVVNYPKKIHFAYERFLKNELRTRYGWIATPLRLIFRGKKKL